jgi:hypothetical protein
MSSSAPTDATPWAALDPVAVDAMLADGAARWWLSGGTALDRWIGGDRPRRDKTTVSTTEREAGELVSALSDGLSAWVRLEDALVPWSAVTPGSELLSVRIHDDRANAWICEVYLEDGTEDRWLYRRDPRLQLPWDRAVLVVDGIPTGAPEVQLVWMALRPSAQDEADKDAALPLLSADARAWWEKAILTIHPHSTWSIHARSPFAPGKASWNRPRS